MAKGGSAALKSAHTKSIKLLAWTTLIFAFAVSAMLPNTFLGDWGRKLLGQIPAPWNTIVPMALLVILVITALVDVYVDWEPNRASIYAVMLLGIVGSAVGGGLAQWISELSHWALNLVDSTLFKAAPPGMGSSAIAVVAMIGVIFMSNRVVTKKSRKG